MLRRGCDTARGARNDASKCEPSEPHVDPNGASRTNVFRKLRCCAAGMRPSQFEGALRSLQSLDGESDVLRAIARER